MKTLIRRWGNSLALRIPKAFADELAVREGLADLLAEIRRCNLHKEIVAEGPLGREVW